MHVAVKAGKTSGYDLTPVLSSFDIQGIDLKYVKAEEAHPGKFGAVHGKGWYQIPEMMVNSFPYEQVR